MSLEIASKTSWLITAKSLCYRWAWVYSICLDYSLSPLSSADNAADYY
jgi:hypothetical protein